MADFDICDIYSHRRTPTKKKTKGKKVLKKQHEKKRKSQFEEILKTRAKLGVDGSRSDSNEDSDSDDHGSSRSKKKAKMLFSDLNKRLNSQQSTQEMDSKNDCLGLADDENDNNNNDHDENNNINNGETATATTKDTSFSIMDPYELTPDVENNTLIELSDDDGNMDDRSTSFHDYSLSSSSSPMQGINYQQSPQKSRLKPLPAIPTIEELTDLDPDLMRLATTSSSTVTASDGVSSNGANENSLLPTKFEKVRVTVQYVPLIKTTDEKLLEMMRIMSEPIKAILMENDPFDKLLHYFCGKKYLKKEDVILVYEGIPVMLRATPRSLNMITGVKAKNLMKAYLKDDYEKQEKEKSENLKRRLEETPFDDKFIKSLEQSQPTELIESESFIRLKLRGKNNDDTNMRVKQTTSLRTIVNRYAELKELVDGAASKIRLSFDGEDLSLDDTIADTELEDEDVVEVIVS